MSPAEFADRVFGRRESGVNDFEIVELAPGDARLGQVWPVMLELRDHLSALQLDRLYAEAYPTGYRVVALFEGAGCRACGSYRLGTSFANGRYLYVEDLVTAPPWRSHGYGKLLLEHLEALARDAGCECVTLDSGVQRFAAHRFYLREGFVISSHHFYRGLVGEARATSMREGRG